MGYVLNKPGFESAVEKLLGRYRLYAPVLKKGEGRFTDTDVVRYDFIREASEIEFSRKSDYSFKELLTPLSETLFFFTEKEMKASDMDERPVIVFLRSCDLHAVRRLDQIYLQNGQEKDWFYQRIREKVSFALMGCRNTCEDGFCVSMGSNRAEDGYVFSVDEMEGEYRIDVKAEDFEGIFSEAGREEAVTPAFVTENRISVQVPESVPLSIYKNPVWEEYNARCIGCGRCNFVCPTCTCYTMQDVFYTENGKVGERRRVAASCMVDGYTDVAGGGSYRKANGERMRFKVLHKIYDYRRRFGYDMCVGCGRCDMVCPEYISFSECIGKLNKAIGEGENG